MNKKNRFSMLEVQSSSKEKEPSLEKTEKHAPTHTSKSIEVVVKDEDFKKNLDIHNLKSQELEIQHQKKMIQSKILDIKRNAWIKIILGIYIVILVAKKYFIETKTTKMIDDSRAELIITRTTLSNNDYYLIALIVAFIYFAFFSKDNKKKD